MRLPDHLEPRTQKPRTLYDVLICTELLPIMQAGIAAKHRPAEPQVLVAVDSHMHEDAG
jgi:hypothetical protein